MENYIVSARKYRPSTFKSVVGQQVLAHTLKTAIDSGRLAHAYLFCGPRGVGKTSCARIFAKTINCQNLTADGEACNECESCKAFNEGRSYNIVELDAASNNSVDNIRDLTDQVRIPPQLGKYKVFIIDEVHMLSTQAFNAFLKTLEEPPAHAIFILATTEKHKIIPTILSRCQIYDFARITVQDIVEQLQYIAKNEGISAEVEALNIIAQKADGAMRDALSIFDQVAASSEGHITYRSAIDNLNVLDYEYYFRLVDAFISGDVPKALLIYKEVREHGFDSLFFVNGLASHIRDLMVAANPATLSLLEVAADVAIRYSDQAKKCPVRLLYKAMSICNDCDVSYRAASNKQFLVELTLIKLCQLFMPTDPTEGKPKLKEVSAAVAGTPARPTAAAQPNTASATTAAQPRAAAVPAEPKKAVAPHTNYTPHPIAQVEGNKVGGIPRISISNIGRKSTAEKSSNNTEIVVERKAHEKNPYTLEQFNSVWNKYIQNHPKDVILINTMRTSFPDSVPADYVMKIGVDNIGQREMVNSHAASILEFIRAELSNDSITLNVTINENSNKMVFVSPQDLVADMMTRNKDFKTFVETFELSIY